MERAFEQSLKLALAFALAATMAMPLTGGVLLLSARGPMSLWLRRPIRSS